MAYFSGLAILFAIAAGYSIYIFLLGNPANFEDGDVAKGHPLGLLGIIYRGGIAIVPLLIAVNITVILIAIERFITLSAASGRGNATEFVRSMQGLLAKNDIDGAIAACDKQRGSLANVVRSGLTRYKVVAAKTDLDRDEKKAAIEKELEEAATCLGASRWQTFSKVIFPSIAPALLTGFAMAFARGMGEYGSVIFIAGNMPMISEITPLIIIGKLEQYDYAGATAVATVMLVISFILLLVINGLQTWQRRHSGAPV